MEDSPPFDLLSISICQRICRLQDLLDDPRMELIVNKLCKHRIRVN